MTGMAEERIIDLGYADPLGEPERSRPTVVGRLSRVGLGLLLLACLATFGGSAVPPASAFTRVGVIRSDGDVPDNGTPTPVAGLVVTTTMADEVVAYHPDGRLAWRTTSVWEPTEERDLYETIEWDGDILQTRTGGRMVARDVRAVDVESVALDPATGRELWRMRGVPRRAGELILVSEEPFDSTKGMRVYRSLPDGLLWTAPPIRMTGVDPATDTLLTLTEQGHFTEYQLSTGKVRRSAELRLPHVSSQLEELSMLLWRDRLILRASAPLMTQPLERAMSYDRATLRPLAQSPLDQVRRVQECGPVLCASSFERTYILDNDTLAQLWYTTPSFISWIPSGLLLWSDRGRLVDERTGRSRVDASGWEPVLYRRGSTTEMSMSALLTRRVGKRTYVARLTPEAIQVLGIVPQRLSDCRHYHELLWCQTDDDQIEVWRHDPRM
jgi:hypothetical protein